MMFAAFSPSFPYLIPDAREGGRMPIDQGKEDKARDDSYVA